MTLDKPIIIIGAARSGTTMLGKILSSHPQVAYVEEPNTVWLYKNARLGTDYLSQDHATDEIQAYIRAFFEKQLAASGRVRIAEKTPSNSLRPAFVRRVFPDCKFLHIIRDGRDVAYSAERKWLTEFDSNRDLLPGEDVPFRQWRKQLQRLRDTPLSDLPAHAPHMVRTALFQLGIAKRPFWGPRFPGIRDFARARTPIELYAAQWMWSVETVLNYKHEIPTEDYLEIRYEDFCMSPREHLAEIAQFTGLEEAPLLALSGIPRALPAEWPDGVQGHRLTLVERIIGNTLARLGYS